MARGPCLVALPLWYGPSMNADQALQELLEVSPQIEAAVIVNRSGKQLAASPGGSGTSPLANLSTKLLDAAEQARIELGREPVVQCEVATGDGNVFVVADQQHVVSAVTSSEPTVGLVFYDLKTALRSIRAGGNGSLGSGSEAKSPVATTADSGNPAETSADSPGSGSGSSDSGSTDWKDA